ncbi:putative cardiolipin-specific deacylase, mitochondrial [Candida viswanathii]|uniref:Putative cardiolipin-specific deacylase, mitochondrial n=1 Tax=Candida viswanathii TaxID=5486 RepID=A0A367YPD6_9ASCO|nr:putative cardiolipin-specific deacylase, mitochondrial [Candida viswanathii]
MSEVSTLTKSTTSVYAEPNAPTVNSITLLESFKDWWASPRCLMRESKSEGAGEESEELKQAKLRNRRIEYALFRAMLPKEIYLYEPGEPEPQKKYAIFGKLLDVKLEDGNTIHEFYLENNTDPKAEEQHIVVIHGYMAAMGYFIKNVEALIKIPGMRLHFIDLPGFGNSSRPKFPKEFLIDHTKLADKISQVLQVENWFIDKIENWRIERKITKFKLIGHSMGGYLSCCYLLKYNREKLVEDVILVSPMGTESSQASLINDEQYQINLHNDPFGELHFETKEGEDIIVTEELTAFWKAIGQPKFPKNWIVEKLWSTNRSPFEILQCFGPFYSKILSFWSFKRFKNFGNDSDTTDMIRKLHNYSYSIFNQYQGSGEVAITRLINHEILAKLPLCDRGLVEFFVDNDIKSLWVYGEKDWMNSNGGQYISEQINKRTHGLSDFEVVDNAGHHLYLDNPKAFNELVIDFFRLR